MFGGKMINRGVLTEMKYAVYHKKSNILKIVLTYSDINIDMTNLEITEVLFYL